MEGMTFFVCKLGYSIKVITYALPSVAVISLEETVHTVTVLLLVHLRITVNTGKEVCAKLGEIRNSARHTVKEYTLTAVVIEVFCIGKYAVKVCKGSQSIGKVTCVLPKIELVCNLAPLFNLCRRVLVEAAGGIRICM